jgi:hypothetical protein
MRASAGAVEAKLAPIRAAAATPAVANFFKVLMV